MAGLGSAAENTFMYGMSFDTIYIHEGKNANFSFRVAQQGVPLKARPHPWTCVDRQVCAAESKCKAVVRAQSVSCVDVFVSFPRVSLVDDV